MMELTNSNNEKILHSFVRLLRKHKEVDPHWIIQITHDYLRRKEGKAMTDPVLLYSLEKDWYEAMRRDNVIPYHLYGDDRYIPDALSCYFIYSKKYIRQIADRRSYKSEALYDKIMAVKSIADLGAGFGLTSVQLRQTFPEAGLIATNLKDTLQFRIMRELSERYGFRIESQLSGVGPVDMVFASEYFEHFREPIDHLREVIAQCSPKILFCANTFTSDAVGHFDSYLINGTEYSGKDIGRIFSREMKELGYKKQDTNLWNNRPSLFMKL